MTKTEITYEQANERYRQMRARFTALSAEILELEKGRWQATGANRIDDAARRMIDGEEIDTSGIEQRLQKLRAEAEVVGRAVDLARKESQKHQKAKNKAVVRELRPEHRLAAARVQRALIELANACDAEARVRQQAPGGNMSLPAMFFPGVGSMSHHDSQVRHFLRYSSRLGYNHTDIDDPNMRAAAE